MKRIILLSVVFLLLIFFVASFVAILGNKGQTSLVLINNNFNLLPTNKIPQRIISLGPLLTEEIYLLESSDRLIADTTYCTKPEDAKNKEKIGSVVNVNVEKIISLKPDLVLATIMMNKKQYEKIKSFGINIVIFPYAKSYKNLCDELIRLGKLIGKENLAQKIISDSEKEINDMIKSTDKLIKKKVFIELGTDPLFTVSKDSFLNDFISYSGGINIAGDAGIGFFSREQVIIRNPDVIIITGMGIEGKNEMTQWKKYNTINAVKNNKIYFIDSYTLCSPNPATGIIAVRELISIIHPEVSIDK